MENNVLDSRLFALRQRREALRSEIRNFGVAQPAALRISVEGKPLDFVISPASGKVAALPAGAWGWAKGMSWRDLVRFLEERSYQVQRISTLPMATVPA